MNPIHIVIREERRKAPRALATVINNDLRTPDGLDKNGMPKFVVTPQPPQLHTLGNRGWQAINELTGQVSVFATEDEAYDHKDRIELDQGIDTARVQPAPFDDNVVYAAEWDQKSPWITILAGSVADLKMTYMGWPMITQAEWEAQNPKGVTE